MNNPIPGLVAIRAAAAQQLIINSIPQDRQFPPFPTILNTPNHIVTFSDIHGDIHALIVCLRDCAGVIRRRTRLPVQEPLGNIVDEVIVPDLDSSIERDDQLDTFLAMNINDPDYRRDLGYEWVDGNTTIVVIIGDLIDPLRRIAHNRNSPVNPFSEQIYYPQLEMKILHFINALNENSLLHANEEFLINQIIDPLHDEPFNYGRIYKLCGNHDLINFFPHRGQENFIEMHAFVQDNNQTDLVNGPNYGNQDVYYISETNQEFTRTNIFRHGNPGFDLYLQTTGTGIMMIINDNIFVHGGLPPVLPNNAPSNLNAVITLNDMFTEYYDDPDMFNDHFPFFLRYLEERWFWQAQYQITNANCNELATRIETFCGQQCGPNPRQLRLFVGHCQQFNRTV